MRYKQSRSVLLNAGQPLPGNTGWLRQFLAIQCEEYVK
jgi:hypothetical protein